MDFAFLEWYVEHESVGRVELRFSIATISQLAARKQRYKLTMFKRLYYILLVAVVVIAIFFVVSSYSFSDRLAEGERVILED